MTKTVLKSDVARDIETNALAAVNAATAAMERSCAQHSPTAGAAFAQQAQAMSGHALNLFRIAAQLRDEAAAAGATPPVSSAPPAT